MTPSRGARKARWALVGSSEFATEWIAPAIQRSTRGTLVAVVSRDEGRARRLAERFEAPHYATSVADLDPECVDVVHVVVPNEYHEPITLAAAERGFHVLVEKPMAPTVDAGYRMAAAAAAAGVQLAVGHCMAWAPPVVRAAELIRGGDIGQVIFAWIAASFDSPPQGLWRQERRTEEGGGPLLDLGPHMADALMRLGGPIVEVSSHLSRVRYDYAAEDSSTALLTFASGAHAVMQTTFACSQNDLVVQGTKGRLSSREWLGRDFAGDLSWVAADRGVGTFGTDDQLSEPSAIPLVRQNVYIPQVENVSAAVLDGIPLAVPARQGLAVLEVVAAAVRSAREGRTIHLEPGPVPATLA